MNKLPLEKRAQILGMMVEGNGIRAISRMTGASKNTIVKLLVDAEPRVRCLSGSDATAASRAPAFKSMRFGLFRPPKVNVPELLHERGDAGIRMTWTSKLDADSKLIVLGSWGSTGARQQRITYMDDDKRAD